MIIDFDIIKAFYKMLPSKINALRKIINRPLTYTEKVLYIHLSDEIHDFINGKDYANFLPDRVAMQDATAQMALLQFMMAKKNKVSVPTTVHADHLIQAKVDSKYDLKNALDINSEVYNFLSSVFCLEIIRG